MLHLLCRPATQALPSSGNSAFRGWWGVSLWADHHPKSRSCFAEITAQVSSCPRASLRTSLCPPPSSRRNQCWAGRWFRQRVGREEGGAKEREETARTRTLGKRLRLEGRPAPLSGRASSRGTSVESSPASCPSPSVRSSPVGAAPHPRLPVLLFAHLPPPPFPTDKDRAEITSVILIWKQS